MRPCACITPRGINPHNGGKPRRIWKITVVELEWLGPFWWSTPDLQKNNDPTGVPVLDSYHEMTIWQDTAVSEQSPTDDEPADHVTAAVLPHA
jgi:hypothetical protein